MVTSTQRYMLNWRSEKKTFTENEEAFKNFDHMLEFDHVRYQMCVPRTSAKSETYMLEFDHVRYQMCVPRTSAKSETCMTTTRKHYAVSRRFANEMKIEE
ncbi:hypothetical protein T4B_10782 [Trichinella pseudospiralis]|uniref:Uncharacterized protein n=1 Tax=Trichinella pseudospiralis TaxID=6337 RepID=A0A0V1IFY6_TRIPS|nr:hypothetical protein T4B_10782 [Trichinella pseudospiralis]